ncbi:conserved hypothetical protein [Parafrankia sp. EAN1pec]|uniref:TetR-like C-terminal domain-containing protein n=1 Tax=Parafrankia sp. (strain EAN1pec) TaxID=298653 RepID=UPI0000542412|nr:conserved hypothetical protein [Frankia sp. EAN1pec]
MEVEQIEIDQVKQAAVRRLADRRRVDLSPSALGEAAGIGLDRVTAYFAGEDELLTTLVLDAYAGMGDGAERAGDAASAAGGSPLDRWVTISKGVRSWALDHPDEYALIWGQPVPGYHAPAETMVVGARTVVALLTVLRDAQRDGGLADQPPVPRLSDGMARNVAGLAAGLLQGLPDGVIARILVTWTQLHGMVGFEVYGHLAGVAADPGAFFEFAAREMGKYVGLTR